MTRADVLIERADLVATCRGPAPRAGRAQGDIAAIAHASVAAWRGRIVAVGPADEVARRITLDEGASVIDGRGTTVVPGFVDSHTHVVFAGDRREELARRLGGATYAEIAALGGGIVRHRHGNPGGHRRRTRRRRPAPPGRCARPGHDHLRGEERLRPRHRDRAEDAARHPRARHASACRPLAHLHGRPRDPRRVPRPA